jgi:hypothetical protein
MASFLYRRVDEAMCSTQDFAPELKDLAGQQVVLDTKGPFLYIGILDSVGADCICLRDADVHDRRESTTSIDLYLIEARKHGVRPNRSVVHVLAREVVSVSPLSAVVVY